MKKALANKRLKLEPMKPWIFARTRTPDGRFCKLSEPGIDRILEERKSLLTQAPDWIPFTKSMFDDLYQSEKRLSKRLGLRPKQ